MVRNGCQNSQSTASTPETFPIKYLRVGEGGVLLHSAVLPLVLSPQDMRDVAWKACTESSLPVTNLCWILALTVLHVTVILEGLGSQRSS